MILFLTLFSGCGVVGGHGIRIDGDFTYVDKHFWYQLSTCSGPKSSGSSDVSSMIQWVDGLSAASLALHLTVSSE